MLKHMNSYMKSRRLMTATLVVSLTGIVATFQACGAGELSRPIPQSAASDTLLGTDTGTLPPDYAKTVSVTHSEDLLVSLVAMAGTNTPSQRTLNAYNAQRTLIPESGKADAVNAPMWMAITNLSGEVCWDLIAQEKALPAAQRRIFTKVDFTKGPSALPEEAANDAIRRLARSAWARNETDEERGLIKEALAQSFAASGAAADTDRSMLLACTAILASLDAHDR